MTIAAFLPLLEKKKVQWKMKAGDDHTTTLIIFPGT